MSITKRFRTPALAIASTAALAVAVAAAILLPAPTQPDAVAQNERKGFTVDAVHSSVLFKVKYFNSSHFWGRFNDVSGSYHLDPENTDDSFIDITIKTASVDTANDGRDNHLRNADFFSARQFPDATFKSTEVTKVDADTLRVAGDFTLRGITKPMTVEVDIIGQQVDPRANAPRKGFDTKFDIKRSEFDVNYGIGPMSDDTTIIISLTGLQR